MSMRRRDIDPALLKAAAETIERMFDGDCLQCGEAIESYYQAGSCVYSSPCKHRQYQGTLDSLKKKAEENQ